MKSIPAVLVGIDFLLLNKREENKTELYLSMVLTKKESRYLSGNLGQNQLNTAPPTSTISIADMLEIVKDNS